MEINLNPKRKKKSIYFSIPELIINDLDKVKCSYTF